MGQELFEAAPENTREAIMVATYRALCTHGYADLRIKHIGREFDRSSSLIYHHYDSKDDLLVDFLGFMLDRAETHMAVEEEPDAYTRLRAMCDYMLPPTCSGEHTAFRRAMTELRAQAAHDGVYCDHFTRSDRVFHEKFASIIRRGIDQGIFQPVDPDRTASFLLTTKIGGTIQGSTADNEAMIRATRRELDEYIEARLLADDAGDGN